MGLCLNASKAEARLVMATLLLGLFFCVDKDMSQPEPWEELSFLHKPLAGIMADLLQGRGPPSHGYFTVGPLFCVGKDRPHGAS